VVTFQPHPQGVLSPGAAPLVLSTKQEKLDTFARLGMDAVLLLPFTQELAALAPEEFVRGVLVDRVRVRELVVGYDFLFGKDRAGDSSLLQRLGRVFGFAVDVVPPVMVDGAAVSSSRIRESIAAGDMRTAARLLGRPYSFRGNVVKGVGRGKDLGFPTANLEVDPEKLLPSDGVYAVRAGVLEPSQGERRARNGLMNIGVRPSFGGRERTVEVHLDGFSGELYRKQLEVEIVERIRDEMDFASSDDLASQIEIDRNASNEILSRNSSSDSDLERSSKAR
jgi:riboflavin kinase/FMN adenylyltransferase